MTTKNRRPPQYCWLTRLACFAMLMVGNTSALARELPKNVLLIMADDIGIECFSCYGGRDYQTPNIDKLATTGFTL